MKQGDFTMTKTLSTDTYCGRPRWTETDLSPFLGTYHQRALTLGGEWLVKRTVTLALPRNEEEWKRPELGMVMLFADGGESYITPQCIRDGIAKGTLLLIQQCPTTGCYNDLLPDQAECIHCTRARIEFDTAGFTIRANRYADGVCIESG